MDNEKMDDLFNVEKMERTIKKAKRRATWKTVLITMLVLTFIVVFIALANPKATGVMEGKVTDSIRGMHEISAPNEFIGKLERYPGFLGGKSYYTTYKIIEGKVVYTGEEGYGYGLFRDEVLSKGGGYPAIIGEAFTEGEAEKPTYNELGQRKMIFYYPFLPYESYRHDLDLLDEIGQDKMMEVALSFDQGHTLQEVQSLIPNDVTLSWVWVDDVDEENDSFQAETMDENGEIVSLGDYLVRPEDTVYGFSLFDANGDEAEEPALSFIRIISSGQKYKTRWQGEYKRLYETLSGEDGILAGNDLQYFGAVVTGNVETLSQLKDLPFIKASSIGVITDKY
ncbi:anti sigma factor C-terminal domain-containing protein [Lysinibacillus sp. 3P01SB]|uniref:anti sigma factor C-terminal domain-containing protein n=1 Tax=Lysinibacillus sp. 3P01SB TaxID=3132284 RepID=UPI0039A7409B